MHCWYTFRNASGESGSFFFPIETTHSLHYTAYEFISCWVTETEECVDELDSELDGLANREASAQLKSVKNVE